MNTTTPTAARPAQGSRARSARTIGGADLAQGHNAQTRRQAAAILEVLAGARTPAEAATALGVSLPRYYQLESRAVRGLVAACAPPPVGRVRSADSTLSALRQENQRLQRDLTRQQALVRTTQRTVGLAAAPAAPAAGKGKAKPRRRRVARALSLAARLQPDAAAAPAAETVAAPPAAAAPPV
jgi:hypothetical protein